MNEGGKRPAVPLDVEEKGSRDLVPVPGVVPVVLVMGREDTGAGVESDDAEALARLLAWIAEGEGDRATVSRDDDGVLLSRTGWRLMRGISNPSRGVMDAWNGLIEGLAMVHNRFLTIDLVARVGHGAPQTVWRIGKRPYGPIVIA